MAHLIGFAIVAFALDRIFSGGDVKVLLVWYLGFAIAHDLVFVPAYTGLTVFSERLSPDCRYRLVAAFR